jgi:hypothetical protein
VGLGYLFPASAGRESFFNLAFRTLAPVLLPRLPAEERARTLAAMWNLAENLESAPVWLARIFYRAAWGWRSLASLEGVVAEVAPLALDEPPARLGASPRVVWVGLADEDRRFLPGKRPLRRADRALRPRPVARRGHAGCLADRRAALARADGLRGHAGGGAMVQGGARRAVRRAAGRGGETRGARRRRWSRRRRWWR